MGDTIDEMGFMIPLSRLFSGEVIEGLKVVPTTPTSTSVVVQPGSAFIRTGAPPSHYAYPICLNTTGGEVVALPPAQSLPMIVDIVAALDIPAIGAVSDTNNPGTWELVAVAGTPNASPSAPTDGQVQTAVSNKPFIRLGRMTHDSTTQSSGVTVLTDMREMASGSLAGGVVTPEKRSGGFKMGVMPGSTFSSTGNKSITGVGFRPKLVKFTVLFSTNSDSGNEGSGVMTTTDQYAVASYSTATAGGRYHSMSNCIAWISGSTVPGILASYVSMDADGFTINVTSSNGIWSVAYEAYA
ncbi:hypothetical protein [Dietzia sp. MNB45]|uniref:hypothetical protein n=1 Tax=Dietzia sp. MNB45 TaxID=3238800 RepID=UPI003F81C3F3